MSLLHGSPDNEHGQPLLVVRHVPWEGPHVILDAFPGVPVIECSPLEDPSGTTLPDPATVRGAIFMGGPMSVNDADTLPGLADEVTWLRHAIEADTPILGVCLGAQLLAVAGGATVTRAASPEVGILPVEVTDPDDPLLVHLAPGGHVMHWHGEQFNLPSNAVKLAQSAKTDVQAFRLGRSAWGMLFHLEVDDHLLDAWLAEPAMAVEARAALGFDYARLLRNGIGLLEPAKARKVFDEFAQFCGAHVGRAALVDGGAH